ncbi:aldo/keto reductase [Colletotrichum karsti]|uniref:Aldo/keto reductase n=1 Tax=Colletotrichum karsti TaxID=1095194 RepID=A0A9P6LEI4_9PEZI|nr:aldo/keto reductase [Colletotrichum karsti]KAF9870121.1 aldo/keto reductase [Colletotrichum karsti]
MASTTVAPIPRLIYGTAWKKAQTAPLVVSALSAGFRGLDTAASHHYYEEGVGAGLRTWLTQNPRTISRSSLYIQTKFSPAPSELPIPDQVHSQIATSLKRLSVSDSLFKDGPEASTPPDENPDFYLDCVLLHSPYAAHEDTLSAWRALESYVPHRIRTIGISNVDLDELHALCNDAAVKPVVVQNRLNPKEAYNTPVRVFCREHGINFQSFWTLTANPGIVKSDYVGKIAAAVGVSNETAMYSLVLGLGDHVSVLDGTTNESRMKGDLEGVEKVAAWAAGEGSALWKASLGAFKTVLGDTD